MKQDQDQLAFITRMFDALDTLAANYPTDKKVRRDLYDAALMGMSLGELPCRYSEFINCRLWPIYHRLNFEVTVDEFLTAAQDVLGLSHISDELRACIVCRTSPVKNAMLKVAELSLNADAAEKIKMIRIDNIFIFKGFLLYYADSCKAVVKHIIELLTAIYGIDPRVLSSSWDRLQAATNEITRKSRARMKTERSGEEEIFTRYEIGAAEWIAVQLLHLPHVLPDWDQLLDSALPEERMTGEAFFKVWIKSSRYFHKEVFKRLYDGNFSHEHNLYSFIDRVFPHLMHHICDINGIHLFDADRDGSQSLTFQGQIFEEPVKYLTKQVCRWAEPGVFGKRYQTLHDGAYHYMNADSRAVSQHVLLMLKNETQGVHVTTNAATHNRDQG